MTAAAPIESAFTRKRLVRTAAGVASAGLMAGFSLVAAAPATAATDADCTDANTLTAPTDDASDIQALLDADTAIICLSGTFDVTSPLLFDHPDLTVHGLSDAVLDGGGVTSILRGSTGTTLTIENMRFTGGLYSGGFGGAIDGYTVHVRDSQFDDNGAGFGGAIHAYSIDISGSTFVDNGAALGAGVLAESEATVTNSTFTSNSAESGGAIYSYGVVTADASTFFDNQASNVGGALVGPDGISVTNSTFVENSAGAEGFGGAIAGEDGLVLQSTFLNNTAGDGQAVATEGGGVDVRGNIFVGETDDAQLAGDTASFTDGGGNVFSTDEATETALTGVQSSTQFSLSPAAVFNGATLADNGGPTQTVALEGGSPAVNAVPVGEPSVDVDQRGVARDALSDSGAYEFVGAIAPDGPALANTGSVPATWLGGIAALFVAAGAVAFGFSRRIRSAK